MRVVVRLPTRTGAPLGTMRKTLAPECAGEPLKYVVNVGVSAAFSTTWSPTRFRPRCHCVVDASGMPTTVHVAADRALSRYTRPPRIKRSVVTTWAGLSGGTHVHQPLVFAGTHAGSSGFAQLGGP
jgi:hypothetical protein